MSSFLSNKFLKYRPIFAQQPPVINEDTHCTRCGYNLRGLMVGRACPECGQKIVRDSTLHDALCSGELSAKRIAAWALAAVAVCPILVAISRIGFSIVHSFVHGDWEFIAYISTASGISVIWCAGVWLITPRRLDTKNSGASWVRIAARWTQLFWIPAFACGLLSLTVFANQAAGDVLSFWSVATGVIAKIGVLFVGMWLLSLAENAELEDAEQRINLSLWVVPILSIIVVFVIPFSLPWFVQAVMLAVYLPWTWYLLRFSYGVWEMHMHVRWSIRLAVESGDRSIAIEQVKQKLQREAEQIIRPLPPQQPAEDIPLTPPGSLHLPQPQPQPQSQPQPHPCPQPHPQPRPQPRSMRESEM